MSSLEDASVRMRCVHIYVGMMSARGVHQPEDIQD